MPRHLQLVASKRRRRGCRTLTAAAAGFAVPGCISLTAACTTCLPGRLQPRRVQTLANPPQQLPGRPVKQQSGQAAQADEAAPAPQPAAYSRRLTAAVAAALGLAAGGGLRRGRACAEAVAAGGAAAVAAAALNVIEKAPLDSRTYKQLTLPNGLRVVLVSDPDGDRAAAAMDVHVGYFSDPEDLPGLAHFCEHMLFLGTQAFPEEGSFDKFMTANSGFSNAFTDNEDTCFFFGCDAAALSGALERFGSFFEAPLFTPEATEREVMAIDSEHSKNLQDDGFRINQVLSSRANPLHPYHHFGTGTRVTLLDLPAKRGRDTRQALFEHYQRFYRTPLMTLCILGRESTVELERLARNYFSGVPGGPAEPASAPWFGIEPFVRDAYSTGVDVVPATDARVLQVGFPLIFSPPPEAAAKGANPGTMTLDTWREYSPSTHVSSVVGHEGPTSLCSLLRRRGLATGLTAGGGEENETFTVFTISVDLTVKGLEQREEVMELLFGWLRLLRELPAWPAELLEENIQLSQAGWQTSEKSPASEAVVQIAGNMQNYPPRDYVSGGARLRGGPELSAAVQALMGVLRPSNAILTTISRSFASSARETETWYGTRFSSRSVLEDRERWEAARPAPGLAPPPPNPFLPRSLALKAPRAKPLPRGVSSPPPSELRRDGRWRLLFRQDTEFGVPKAFACITLLTSYPRSNARTTVLSRLYELLLRDGLTESLLYDARLAGLVFELSTSSRGVELVFAGFDDRLVDFVRASVAAFRAFDVTADRARFEAQKDVMAREYGSFAEQPPFQQVSYWTGLATTTPAFTIEELQDELKKTQPSDLGEYALRLWGQEQLYGTALCQGNLRPDEAQAVVDAVDASLPFKPLPEKDWPAPCITQIPARPQGLGCVLIREVLDPAEENSAVQLVFQAGLARCRKPDTRKRWAVVQVLSAALRDRFYSELRTKQQLGYVVNSGADRREGVALLGCLVQSSVLDPLGVLRRMDEFLLAERTQLAARPEDEIKGIAAALADTRLTRPQQLGSSVDRTIIEIKVREYQWDRAVLEAEALRAVSRKDLLELFDKMIVPGGAERRRWVTLVYGKRHRADLRSAREDVQALGGRIVEDPKMFAKEEPHYDTTR